MNEHTSTADVPDLLRARVGALDLVGNGETIRSLLSSCCSSGRPAEVNLVQTVVDGIRKHQNIQQKAITEVSDELTAVREGPFRCGEICTANAHEAAIAFKRSVMSRLWSAADFLQYAKCHGDSSLRMDSSVIADRFEDICQAFQDRPFPPAKEITAEIMWEAAKACQARGTARIANDGIPASIVFGRDYRSCRWGGELFTFTPIQAKIVRSLDEARQQGTHDVAQTTLLEEAGSSMEGKWARLRDLFRSGRKNHSAWQRMIVDGESKGTCRLADPPD